MESIVSKSSHKCKRMATKLKDKVIAKRKEIKSKNKEKLNRYKYRKISEDISKEKSSLPEAYKQFENLRVFNGEILIKEPLKKPCISTHEVKLSEVELKVLTKNPKFALRNVLDKVQFMAEVEKGLVKECYSRIGKGEDKGEVGQVNGSLECSSSSCKDANN